MWTVLDSEDTHACNGDEDEDEDFDPVPVSLSLTDASPQVFLKEKARKILERRWNQKLSWAIVTLQRNLRGLINRRRLQAFKQKATVIQAHFRGFLARKRYQRLKKTLTQFGVSMIVSRPLVHRRRQYQVMRSLVAPMDRCFLLPKSIGGIVRDLGISRSVGMGGSFHISWVLNLCCLFLSEFERC
ncbi:unconventional myosin heavy chain 6-like [Anolis carolinensis]|uniref:unconventional myosin heavy chain 6-like n=1 Tax=Anolis carolinensis TaxID=28377 RepID=UPI002F2B5C1E